MSELFDPYELRQTLMNLAEDIRENYVSKLIESGHYTTEYALIDSVRTNIEVNDTTFTVVMYLNDYWKYVEYDTKPHFPPPDKLLQWIEIKPVHINKANLPTPKALENKKKSLAFLIGCNIAKYGTKGTHDLERTEDAIIPFYEQKLQEALHHDVERFITKLMAM